MAEKPKTKVKLNRVWIETGIEINGVPQLREITDDVKVVANLLGAVTPNKTPHYFDTCQREAERLQKLIITTYDGFFDFVDKDGTS